MTETTKGVVFALSTETEAGARPPARRRFPPRLVAGWALVASSFALGAVLREVMDGRGWAYVWALAFFITSKMAMLLRLDAAAWRRLSWGRLLAYFAWLGMRPEPFLEGAPAAPALRPSLWISGLLHLAAGACFLWVVPRALPSATPWIVRVWIGVVGYAFVFIFALTDGWAALYRYGGVPVEKLWVNPPAARSLAEFWGQRWNRIFSGFARAMLFQPLARVIGTRTAALAVFLFSGLLHEWTWSVPVRGGYGGPTLYFLIQGLLVRVESSAPGRFLRGRPLLGRLWTWLAVVGPLPLALHPAYLAGDVTVQLTGLGVRGL
jgi:alginate O-acetyltransferase complex protein AlgI